MIDEVINKLFYGDKSDWYSVNNAGEKDWNTDQVKNFWSAVRHYKMGNHDYNFEHFVFPKFQRNGYNATTRKSTFAWDFWEKGQVMDFNGDASFVRAKFLDQAELNGIKYQNVKFIQTHFTKSAHFNNSIFTGEANFNYAQFDNSANFAQAHFNRSTFSSTKFNEIAYFLKTEFQGNTRFYRTSIKERAVFDQTFFLGPCEFKSTLHLPDISFISAYFANTLKFENTQFQILNFEFVNQKSYTYGETTHAPKPPNVEFIRSHLNTRCVFSWVDMREVNFVYCDVSEITFSNCVWVVESGRLFHNEDKLSLHDAEVHYRGLKRNFEAKKDWELSGLCYVSEMEMRKKRLLKENKYFSWFIFWFYGSFSGYTQNYKRPLISLIGLILLSSVLYFFIDCNIGNAIQRGIHGALPYLKIELKDPFQGWWLVVRNFEFLLGGIFLAFFVLALRKRFKQ